MHRPLVFCCWLIWQHDLHVSPDLGDLPPAWLEALKAQGLSEADLLLISAARHKASQRPLLRIVKGSTPPPNEMPTSAGPAHAHAHARGMSTPAHLVNLQDDTPMLDKRFSWERNASTPTHTSSSSAQLSPFREYRQSLQESPSPPSPQTPRRLPDLPSPEDPQTPRQLPALESPTRQGYREEEETPRKTKRWSDQLKGFQSSFSSLGGDDDWGSQLTLALGGQVGLQTVDEVDSTRGESMDSARTHPPADPERPITRNQAEEEVQQDTTPRRSSRKNPKSLSIYAPAPSRAHAVPGGSTTPAGSPSPRSPGGTRIRRKPVPHHERVYSTSRSPQTRQSIGSASPSLDRPWPRSPPPPPRRDKPSSPASATHPQSPTTVESFQASSESFGVHASQQSPSAAPSQSTESELEPDLRTPSTNRHFFHSPSSSASHPSHLHAYPPMPRSISEESQFTLASVHPQPRPDEVPDMPDHSLAAFSFPAKLQPRSNPRHSMPASAGYTESSPPSRGMTPRPCDEREWEQYQPAADIPMPLPNQSPSTPPRLNKKTSSRRSKAGPNLSPPSARKATAAATATASPDPLAGLDQANMAERASIALSYISNQSDMRSSMASSLRSSYLHDAKVLKAYTRDLGGVEERDSASETESSFQNGTASTSEAEEHQSGSTCSEYASPGKSARAPYASRGSARARSSRRLAIPPRQPPHPFASRKTSESGHETDDEALKALEVAAKEMAKRTGRYASVSSDKRASGGQGVFSDADE